MLQILTLAALLAANGGAQRPPTPEEQQKFDEGTRAMAAGDARGAEKAWRAGYDLGHDSAFLVHVGEAQEKAGQNVQAAQTYAQYLHEAPNASDRADIEQRIARLAPPAPAPGPAVAAPATAPAPAASAPATPPLAAAPDAEKPGGNVQEDSGWNRYNITAMVSAGLTVALLGTAAFYGASAGSHESDANRLIAYHNPPTEYANVAGAYTSALSDGRRDAHDARIALIAAAATGAVSITFFILDGVLTPATGGPTAAIAPMPHGMAAVGGWSWRF